MKTDRIGAIDATRGTAMLFVFVSHFGLNYFQRTDTLLLHRLSEAVGMVATPTFVMISGLMLGYLFQTKRAHFGLVRSQFLDRGLFYLIVGHLLITCSRVPREGGWWNAAFFVFITDMIGVCMIAGPPLVERYGSRFRVGLGAVLYCLSWVASLNWSPRSVPGRLAYAILFGNADWVDARTSLHLYTFPLGPWFSVYIASTAIGERVASLQLEGHLPQAGRLIQKLSMWALGLAALVLSGVRLAKGQGFVPAIVDSEILARYQKLPPGPVYLLFYGGLGLAILSVLFVLPNETPWSAFIGFATMLGRTSFFVFVLQYFIYDMVFFAAHLAYTQWWPAYLLGSVAVIALGSWFWLRQGFNRYLTLRPL